jgi:hypothetical protein
VLQYKQYGGKKIRREEYDRTEMKGRIVRREGEEKKIMI